MLCWPTRSRTSRSRWQLSSAARPGSAAAATSRRSARKRRSRRGTRQGRAIGASRPSVASHYAGGNMTEHDSMSIRLPSKDELLEYLKDNPFHRHAEDAREDGSRKASRTRPVSPEARKAYQLM